MATVRDVYGRVRARKGFEDLTKEDFTNHINRVHKDILIRMPVRVNTEDISLTSGTKEYALDSDIVKVWEAYRYDTSSTGEALTATSVHDLHLDTPHFRFDANGKPKMFYVWNSVTTGDVIGFHPTPDTTTSSGYPKITLHVTRENTLDMTTTLPTGVKDHQIYIEGVCYYAAMDVMPEKAQFWFNAYQMEMDKNRRFYQNRNPDHSPSVAPRIYRRGYR